MKKHIEKIISALYMSITSPIWIIAPILITIVHGWASFVLQYPQQCNEMLNIIFLTIIMVIFILCICIATPFGLFLIAPFLLFSLINAIISVYSVFWTVNFNSEYFSGLKHLFGDNVENIFKYSGIFTCIPILLLIVYWITSIIFDLIYDKTILKITP